jgi:hypothetical protein
MLMNYIRKLPPEGCGLCSQLVAWEEKNLPGGFTVFCFSGLLNPFDLK